MLVVMKHNATSDDIDAVVAIIRDLGYDARPIPGGQRTAVGTRSDVSHRLGRRFAGMFSQRCGGFFVNARIALPLNHTPCSPRL